jgi:hypothetical protein
MKHHLILLYLIPLPAIAQIDSGGGTAQVGSYLNHSSVGSPITTQPTATNGTTNRPGLIEVLYAASGSTPPPEDSDGNGLPDAWELEHFGRIGIDPHADEDGDGNSNLMEFLAGTNPVLSSSFFRPEGVFASGIFSLPIQTQADRNYRVYATNDLATWHLHQTIEGDGTLKVFTFDETAVPPGPLHSNVHPSKYFFRVEISLP